jgi:hypothetical protein
VRLVGALVLLPVIALIAVVGVLATLPTWVSPERVRQEVVAAAHEALGVEVELASLDYHLSWGLELRDLRIGPPAGFTRDVLHLRGLDLRWTLPWRADGAVIISRAALIEPRVVIETLNGVRNLDRLVPPSKEPPPPDAPPGEPLRGPLSPVLVQLTDIAVERAALEVVGEGPNLSIEGLSLRLDARLDPQQLTAQLALTSTRAPVAATLPQPDGTRQRVTTALDASVKLVVEADTHDGLRLSRTRLDVDLRTAQLDPHGAPPIPPADLRVRAGLELRADTDTLVIAPLALELDGHRLVELGARVDGVVAAAAEVLADPSSLVASLGLVRSARDGRLQISGPGVVLALDPLLPYVRAFAPTLTVGGEVRLVVDELAGRLPELVALRPSTGSVRLELDHVRVSDPAQRLVVGRLDGALALRAAGSRPITLGGEVRGSAISAQGSGVDSLALGLSGAIAAPSYPATGTTSIAVSLALKGVRAPGTRVSALDATLTLGGHDPLDPTRSHPDPIQLALTLDTRGVVVGTGTAAQSVAELRARLGAQLDRLVTPALRPIQAQLDARIGGVAVPAAQVGEVLMALTTSLDDPRHGRPIDARLAGRLEVASVRAGGTTVARAVLTSDTRVRGVDTSGKEPLPAMASIQATLDVPAFALAAPSKLASSARVDTTLSFTRAGQALVVDRLRAQLGGALDATLRGRVEQALSPTPALDLTLAVAPLDLAQPVVAQLVGEPFTGSGRVRFDADVRGRWTGVDDLLAKLDTPPLLSSATLTLDDVSAHLPDRALTLEHARGTLGLALSSTAAGTRGTLAIGSATQGAQVLRGLSSAWTIGLFEGVWKAQLALDAAALGDTKRSVEAAEIDVDVVHVPFGEVLVRSFVLRAPGAGVEARIDGRLARGRYGAVVPELDARASLDFDRLKSVFGSAVPESLVVLTGQLGFELGAHAHHADEVELSGALTLEHLGWRGNGTILRDASGRVPFSQRLRIELPSERLLGGRTGAVSALAESGLGLSRGLDALGDALARQSKLVLLSSDVLSVAPRTADYESLRPYYRSATTAKLTIAELSYAHYVLTSVSMDTTYVDGVFRVDRFATGIWGGAMFGDMAFQIAGQDHLRLRLRATMTDVNLDVPVAAATDRDPAQGSDAEPYLVAGNLDLRVDLRDRTLNGYFDFTKMGSDALVGLIDGMDPAGKNKGLQETRTMVSSNIATLANWTGVSLRGTVLTIRNNLMDLDFTWSYDLFRPSWNLFIAGVPILTRLAFGPVVMRVVASPLKGYSLSNYLEEPWVKNLNESVFTAALRGRLIVDDEGALARGAAP